MNVLLLQLSFSIILFTTLTLSNNNDICTKDQSCSLNTTNTNTNTNDNDDSNNEQEEDVCWNPIMADEQECDCQYECVHIGKDSDTIWDCLRICGFAIVPNAYNDTVLRNIYNRFFVEMSFEERDEFAGIPNHLRGNRIEYLVPHWEDSEMNKGLEGIIYDQFIVDTVLNFMKDEMNVDEECPARFRKEPIIFDQLTFIWAPGTDDGGDVDQGFHDDSSFGIKMQVPLVDTNYRNGPVEIVPLKGMCPIIKGIVSVGTVIIYQQQVFHRGSKNNDKNCRPVIDMSFMILSHHWRDAYIRQNFHQPQFVQMGKHQEVFVKKCKESPTCPLTRQTIFVEDEI